MSLGIVDSVGFVRQTDNQEDRSCCAKENLTALREHLIVQGSGLHDFSTMVK